MKQGALHQSSLTFLVVLLAFVFVRTTDLEARVEAQSAIHDPQSATGARKQSKENTANTRVGIGSSFKGPLGLQLYSLRADFPKDVPRALAKVPEMRVRKVVMGGR